MLRTVHDSMMLGFNIRVQGICFRPVNEFKTKHRVGDRVRVGQMEFGVGPSGEEVYCVSVGNELWWEY